MQNTLHINDPVPVIVSARIISKLIAFRKVKIRACMIPRPEIVAVSIENGTVGLKETVIKSDYAKIMVYRHDIDASIDYCHAQDLFKKPRYIESILKSVNIVSETNLANEVMVQLTTEGKS
jgi:putative hemolysin